MCIQGGASEGALMKKPRWCEFGIHHPVTVEFENSIMEHWRTHPSEKEKSSKIGLKGKRRKGGGGVIAKI